MHFALGQRYFIAMGLIVPAPLSVTCQHITIVILLV